MFYGSDVESTRRMFFLSWEKAQQQQSLTALEQQLVTVIEEHPEYHAFLEMPPASSTAFSRENPFLHMGLHLALRDQIATNQPLGVQAIFQELLKKYKDTLRVEHIMMECLSECLWDAQKKRCMPNESLYLLLLQGIE